LNPPAHDVISAAAVQTSELAAALQAPVAGAQYPIAADKQAVLLHVFYPAAHALHVVSK